ncbi:Spc98 family protein [Aaosphaeria arxii CBS 175.79]|uniref:Spindle pole body component n=1 Tax=Aaosphaeria arxii CBS 175.79 TaxID=1450172 RepID=A0A6A5XAP1_9PLEO|nr:Spc98 family protein [Aaosphaeria arxii CBS 175.79]KAF2009979.1 Spc98 family protein [Aaosphaeria arxii CBS 175.79]
MLHEILLSLSGHPSALFDAPSSDRASQKSSHVTNSTSPLALLSAPEAELLSSLAHLSRLHRRIRDHVAKIAASHPSTVCRAVATAITSHHLENFQRKVLDVESRILTQDASAVGAYNIVPLAAIVAEFSEFTRPMEWLWEMSVFMLDADDSSRKYDTERVNGKTASGAEIMNKLRSEAQTGYPDIEETALHLGKVAETSWLRQLSTWLLYGRLPSFGATDFFISAENEDDLVFVINHKLLPKFVTRQTASSMLFIGKSLNQIRSLPASSKTSTMASSMTSELDLLPTHVGYLSEITAPISSAKMSSAVTNIRLSLSRNLLQHLLPRERIVEILTLLYQFFLLGRGEFATVLIAEADEKLQSRHRAPAPGKPGHGIQGVLLKENEINNTLSRAWSVLASLGGEDDHTDDILDLAMDIVHLNVQPTSAHRPGTPGRARESNTSLPTLSPVVFSDLLLSVPTSLTFSLQPPLDLFMTKHDLDVYSTINAYLLACRRAHLHLTHLWKQSSIRREHPAPPNHTYTNTPYGRAILAKRRTRFDTRTREMRKVWATCSAAIFFLSESEAYFAGEVIRESFNHFLAWVSGPTSTPNPPPNPQPSNQKQQQQHDPESLTRAHRLFLTSITTSLLLTDTPFTTTLRSFLAHASELTALISRLQVVRASLDLADDDGVEDDVDLATNLVKEEGEVRVQLDRARRRLDGDMKALVGRLRDIDAERVGGDVSSVVGKGNAGGGAGEGGEEGMVYKPLRIGGVDRLLMKLDWGAVDDEGDGDDDDEVGRRDLV